MTTLEFLAGWALRSSILILSGSLLMWALRVKDPSIRWAAWTALLCGSLAIPAMTATLPRVPVAVMSAANRPVEAIPEFRPAQGRFVVETFAVTHSTPARRPFDWIRAVTITYFVVAVALLLRLCIGLAMSCRLLHGSRATGLGPEVRESDDLTSPVALGIVRAVIVLPSDWREWDAAKRDAVLAHERSHIRRHDPAVQLLSAFHRALLWFSPLSWFLHRRIVQVAEEASDDAALAVHRDRASYAETLLGFMQCGVRGGNMHGVAMARYGSAERRIDRIPDGTALSRGITRWSVAAIVALGAPLAFVVAAADKPLTFDVASVKLTIVPNGVTLDGEGRMMVRRGSGVSIPQDTGGPGTDDRGRIHYPVITLKELLKRGWDSYYAIDSPGWTETQVVAVEATMPADTTKAQLQEMLRNLVVDRFGLKFHSATKEVTGYALTVAKNGPKMKESPDQNYAVPAAPPGRPTRRDADGFLILPPRAGPFLMSMTVPGDRNRIVGQQETMQDLAAYLRSRLNAVVKDSTGMTAKYDFTLTYTGGTEPGSDAAEPMPDIFSALQAQLGLRLEAKKVAVEVMVVDHMDRSPAGN